MASISTRTTQVAKAVPNQMTTAYGIPEDYKMDMKPFIKRPFYLGQMQWRENDPKYSYLTTPVRHLPADVILSNTSLRNAIRVGAMMKPSLELHISLNGTLTHAGCLLFGVLPPGPILTNSTSNVYMINTILSGPHVKLFANEATSAVLEVPWYCNTDMCETTIVDQNVDTDALSRNNIPVVNNIISESRDRGSCVYATLVCMVLNPLRPGLGVNALTVTMEAIFKEFELAVPTPRFLSETDWVAQSGKPPLWKRATTGLLDLGAAGAKSLYPIFGDAIDTARGVIRSLTGLHNFNIPIISDRIIHTWHNYRNATDIPQFFEKMDQSSQYNRICKEPVFGTSYDEMNIGYITSKPQYLGSFEVDVSTPAGTVLWSRPISPFQGAGIGPQPHYTAGDASKQIRLSSNNIELMHALHRYWRGDLAVTLEVVMNNKTHVKLKVIKYYAPGRYAMSDRLPTMMSLSNAPSQLLEFSAGAQRYCVDLPYLGKNELMPCAEDTITEAMYHGIYIVYLAQPMVIGDSSPSVATVNVYIRGVHDHPGSNLQFYGYSHKNVFLDRVVPGATTYYNEVVTAAAATVLVKEGEEEIVTYAPDDKWEPQSGGSQSCMPACTVPMNQPQEQENDFTFEEANNKIEHHNRLLPNVDIRPLIRRMYETYRFDVGLTSSGTDETVLNLATLLAESQQGVLAPSTVNQYRSLALISSMFHGKSCVGFKMRLEYKANYPISCRVYYIPPGITLLKTEFICNLTMAQPNPAVFNPTVPNAYNPSLMMASNDRSVDSLSGAFEFLVPDMNPFKFVGGHNKYRPTNVIASSPQEDMGSIYIVLKNGPLPVGGETNNVSMDIFTGLTDESRLGFHTIAPIFGIRSGNRGTYGISRFNSPNIPAVNTLLLPRSLYKGHPSAV